MEFTFVYIEQIQKREQKRKNETATLLNKAKVGILIKQHRGKGKILFMNSEFKKKIED